MQKVINFIRYHNSFAIGVALIFVVMGGAFASETVRNAVIGEEIVMEQGIDNSQILAADLDNFDLALQIQSVSEDEENYYIDYTYRTLVILDNRWQEVLKEETLTVSKETLGDRDLGFYVAEELGEVANYQLSYLKEVQEIEREKGLQKVMTSVKYTGLKGLVLDIKNKVLPGYEPIVEELEGPEIMGFYEPKEIEEPASAEALAEESQPSQPSSPSYAQFPSQGEIEALIVREIAEYFTKQGESTQSLEAGSLSLETSSEVGISSESEPEPPIFEPELPPETASQSAEDDSLQPPAEETPPPSEEVLSEEPLLEEPPLEEELPLEEEPPVEDFSICEPQDEICDGTDNDCDGLIDEDLVQQCGTTNVGACEFGTQICAEGVWGECVGMTEPTEEVCDGLDNDCDGQVDGGGVCETSELPPESLTEPEPEPGS